MKPPDWFWALLDSTRPSLQALATRLERLPRERLIAYADTYVEAMFAVCEPWDGPLVSGVQFSEDDTEDFTEWVVSQGQVYWERACKAERLDLFVREHIANRRAGPRRWNPEVGNPDYRGWQSCKGIAFAVFQAMHGADLHDFLGE